MRTLAIIVLCALLSSCATTPPFCNPPRDKNGRIARSAAVVVSFKKRNPCPSTNLSRGSCPGYVVDHIKPLCTCGADVVNNMQWQTISEAKEKDKWECQKKKAPNTT